MSWDVGWNSNDPKVNHQSIRWFGCTYDKRGVIECKQLVLWAEGTCTVALTVFGHLHNSVIERASAAMETQV